MAPITLQGILITYKITIIQDGMPAFSFDSNTTSISYELDSSRTNPCQTIQVNITSYAGSLEGNTSTFELLDKYFIKGKPQILSCSG